MQIKKYKWKIILILLLIGFFTWISVAPYFLSKHFHELYETYIEKTGKLDAVNKNSVTYAVDKLELHPNSYREIIEISGFAFKELKKEIKSRDIFIILESTNGKNNYIVKTQLMQRPEVLRGYLPGEDISKYIDTGYYAKFPAIGIKNGNYKIRIRIKENNENYDEEIKFIMKKDKGMVTILPVN